MDGRGAARRVWNIYPCLGECGGMCRDFVANEDLRPGKQLLTLNRDMFYLTVKKDLMAPDRPHGIYWCAGRQVCRRGFCFAYGISENVLETLQREAKHGVLVKEHGSLGQKRGSRKRLRVREWILNEAEEFGDDDPGGSGRIHLALVDSAEWYEMYSEELRSLGEVELLMSRERFDYVLRYDPELKKRLIFSRHVVQKSCSVCEGWRNTKRNLRRQGYTKADGLYQEKRGAFLKHIEFIKGQKRALRTIVIYCSIGAERWWILDFDLSFPFSHPTCFVDTKERRQLKCFRSLFFGLRDLTLNRSLILTHPGNGPLVGRGTKGTWKGLNVSLSGLFSYIYESIQQFGNSLPTRLLIINDGGERTHALILLLGIFSALRWFEVVTSYSNIPGHTHGKTDSLFGLGRKCVRKLSKFKSVSYLEIFNALNTAFPGWDSPSDYVDYGSIAVRELTTVFDWKKFFHGCRSADLGGALFPRVSEQQKKPHVFTITRREWNDVVQPGVESFITGFDFMTNSSHSLSWVPIFRKYPDFGSIPVDTSMYSIFEADKRSFIGSIIGRGVEEGAKQGLTLQQVCYYKLFRLPSPMAPQDPFFLSSYHFRSREPEELRSLKRRRPHFVQYEDDDGYQPEKDDDSVWDEFVDDSGMVKVMETKLKKGSGGRLCFVLFQDGTSRWVLRDFVPDDLVRSFQNETRGNRRGLRGPQPEKVGRVFCSCGRAFDSKQGLMIHKGKSTNTVCKE